MMARRSITVLGVLACGAVPALRSQAVCRQPSAFCADSRRLMADGSGQRASFQRAVVHGGKWLTAAGVVALIVVAEREHSNSRREWNALLDICRSAQDACALGADGRYVRGDAEQLYQRSRAFDRRANRWLLGAQASLLATTALFIIDLHPGQGPDNIPYPPVKVGMRIPL